MPAFLLGDAYRVEHVISNLLSNAIRFGAFRVKVDAVAGPEDNEETSASITVSISDEGLGISEENQKSETL